jgi:hypothetical protein
MDPSHRIDDGIDAAPQPNDAEIPLSEVFEQWRPQLVAADRELRVWIRKNPLAALATAACAGFLLARWMRK